MSKPIRIKSFDDLSPRASKAKQRSPHVTSRRSFDLRFPEDDISRAPTSVTSTKLALTLPIPPSINHQYATVNGRRILSSKGRQYKTFVTQQILATLSTSSNREALLNNLKTHSLILSIRFFFTSALRRDLDGGLKIAQDAICNSMDINDNRISEIHLHRAIDAKFPRMECSLSIQASASLPRQKKKRESHRISPSNQSRAPRQQ